MKHSTISMPQLDRPLVSLMKFPYGKDFFSKIFVDKKSTSMGGKEYLSHISKNSDVEIFLPWRIRFDKIF